MIYLILIILSNSLQSQVFESKRNLLETKKTKYEPVISIGVGVDYLMNQIIADDKEVCSCYDLLTYISDRNFVPSVYLKYRNSKRSVFSFDFTVSYFNLESENIYNEEIFVNWNNREFITEMNFERTFIAEYFDIGAFANYDILGFKQVSLFAGLKARIGNVSYFQKRTLADENNEIIDELTRSNLTNNNTLNYAIHLGASYNGTISKLPYEIRFNYVRNINPIELSIQTIYDSSIQFQPNYSLSSFGIGFVLFYDIFK
jgi:hypothetical protein